MTNREKEIEKIAKLLDSLIPRKSGIRNYIPDVESWKWFAVRLVNEGIRSRDGFEIKFKHGHKLVHTLAEANREIVPKQWGRGGK